MRILLDTNIFIYREDDHVLPDNLQELLRILIEAKSDVILHPSSLRDLKKDSDERRKKVMESKIKTYPLLESPPDSNRDIEYLNIIKNGYADNDAVDNEILYAVHKDAVDFLITEDRGIHKKASKLGINDRVLLIDEALQIFEEYLNKERTHFKTSNLDFSSRSRTPQEKLNLQSK
jgi:rRNA-processing protein FCF1